MSYRLHITSTAERDLTQSADYIEFVLKNPSAADSLLEEADRKINALLPFPEEHPLVDDKLLASLGIRFVPFTLFPKRKNRLPLSVFSMRKATGCPSSNRDFPLSKASLPIGTGRDNCR